MKKLLRGWAVRRRQEEAVAPPARDEVKAALQAGLRHHQAGALAAAQACYSQALAADPGQADALHLLGVIAHQMGDHERAAGLIGQAIEISPDFASYHTNLGNVLVALGRGGEAVGAYEAAIRLQPDYAEVHCNLGNALRGLGRHEAAAGALREAVRLRPDYLPAHAALGALWMEREQFEAALAAYEAGLRCTPDWGEGLSGRGLVLLRLGRAAEARASFEGALRLMPGQAAGHCHLGIALQALGLFDEAVAAFEAALRLDPEHDEARMRRPFALYNRLESLGEYEAGFAHLREGNRLRRAAIGYEEGPVLGLMARIKTVFSPAVLGRAVAPGGGPDVPIFILGMPRSGSTLVEQILASHPAVAGGGERRELGEMVARLGGYPAAIAAGDLAAAGAAYRARLRAAAPGAGRITDKQPANFHHVGFIRLALPGAKIIHTRRDPVDTCLSCFAQIFDEAQPFTNDLEELGRYYRGYAGLMAHWRESLPAGAMLEVEYEALVADFEPQVRRILEYCELDWDPACLAFYEHERAVLTASAAQVRQPLYGHAAGRARAYGGLLDGLRAALEGRAGG